MMQSTKRYGHEQGLSCCFRQHNAVSHCHLLHGYAIAVKLVFEAEQLDLNGWVMDFGSLKPVKQYLADTFDHKLLVAQDDPMLDHICELAAYGIADVLVVPRIGCESFAQMIYEWVNAWMISYGYKPRVRLVSCEVAEHAGNSAIYLGAK